MEYAVMVLGVLVGKLWTSSVSAQLRRSSASGRPALLLSVYVVLAIVTGLVIRLVEIYASLPAPVAGSLSKGLIAGFVWSSWFLPGAHALYARHQVGRAITYLVVAPVLVFAGVLGGYLAHQLKPYLA
jgi:fluoride ion exporter CrcB/FEX